MDILRKELNAIYQAQHLELEALDPDCVAGVISRADTLVGLDGACAVVTDAACDRCHIFAGRFGVLMGLTDRAPFYRQVDSSDEDEIYNRIHPEDLVEKRMLEYEFFRLVDGVAAAERKSWKATCRIRMKDGAGNYRPVENSTQLAELSPGGKIWLILCRYDLSPLPPAPDGIEPRIVNNRSGEVKVLSFGERRKHVLSPREKEILRLIQQGKPSKQIAALLQISVNTVNRHRQNIIGKLSVGNSIEAITAATAMKLL